MIESCAHLVADAVQQLIGRHDIENRQLCDSVGVVERHAVPNTPSAVVPYYGKLLELKVAHHFHLVERHASFRVVGMILAISWLAAVAISTQVGSNYGEFSGQAGCDFVPHYVRLRAAMQQQHGRTLARPKRR
jgi:hypothetical protein